MASPVILKPLALSLTEAVPMVVLLKAPHVWDADAPGVTLTGYGRLAPAELGPARSGEASVLRGKPTAREAFLDFAAEVASARWV
jgi:hypothetical protein